MSQRPRDPNDRPPTDRDPRVDPAMLRRLAFVVRTRPASGARRSFVKLRVPRAERAR